jgi:hypothetical protein
MLPSYFVVIGTLIGAVSSIGYLVSTIRGDVRPNRVSFFMWSIAPTIAFFAEIGQGVGLLSIQTLSAGILPFSIFLASFINKQAEWKLTKFDLFCGLLSVVGLVIWLVSRVGNIAILLSILADGLAALPTIIKAYRFPESEIAWPWAFTALGNLLSLLTIKQWTLANYGFILYICIVTTLIFALAQFMPRSQQHELNAGKLV